MKKQKIIILAIILVLAFILRVYRLSEVPPSLGWDEVSIGYDAWSITLNGQDQWGKSFPFIFKSFGEFKYPFHIYATALSIKFLGLSDFSVRLPSALMGVVNVLLLFLIIKKITKNELTATVAAIFLAISPWAIQFSRVNWETNFALFFFFGGLLLFLYRDKNPWFLIASFLLFGLDIYTYNAAKVFIPLFVTCLSLIYIKDLLNQKLVAFFAFLIFGISLLFTFINPELSGRVRFQQVSFGDTQIQGTKVYEITKNRNLGKMQLVGTQYLSHFSPEFLFLSGDKNPRHSIQTVGHLFLIDILFIPLGLVFLFKNMSRYNLVILLWFVLAPFPASITKEAPHASRAMFALGGWQIVSAMGFSFLYRLCKTNYQRMTFLGVTAAVLAVFFINYVFSYFGTYPNSYSQEWQYGYKKIFLDYMSEFNKYDKVIVSDNYGQPYIFALYYLRYDPNKFRDEVEYNSPDRWGMSTVKGFANFDFRPIKWNELPSGKLLVFASPAEKPDNVLEKASIKNLNGSIAFYVYEY